MASDQRTGPDGHPRNLTAPFGRVLHGPIASLSSSFTSSATATFLDQPKATAFILATATGGTNPTVSVVFQDSYDGTNFADALTLSLTTAGTKRGAIDPVGPYVRATGSLTGTDPTFSAFQVQVYAK